MSPILAAIAVGLTVFAIILAASFVALGTYVLLFCPMWETSSHHQPSALGDDHCGEVSNHGKHP